MAVSYGYTSVGYSKLENRVYHIQIGPSIFIADIQNRIFDPRVESPEAQHLQRGVFAVEDVMLYAVRRSWLYPQSSSHMRNLAVQASFTAEDGVLI